MSAGELVVELGNVRRVSRADWIEVGGPRARALVEAVATGRAAVWIDGARHTGPVGWCPVDLRVFPHLSIRENLAYAGIRRAEVDRVARLLGLTEVLERRPRSVGAAERRATALGRALLVPRLWVLDEALRGAPLDVVRAEREARGARVIGIGLPEPEDRWEV